MTVPGIALTNPSRLWFLRTATALMPLILLALTEGALRLVGYGDDYALFVESAESERYLTPNPDVITRYFAVDFGPALSIETNYFLKDKPDGAIRLFVQGGSTAAGFPFGNDASIAGMLGARLRQHLPDRTVEIVNTAMSAVTSYTLLDFADEIIEQDPDAVLIYAGHNEYVGIFGVGSAYAPTGWRPVTLLTLELDGLRLYQLIRNLYVQARLLIDEPEPPDATTLMAAIARDRNIALGSARYRQGIEQFRKNIARLADKYRAAGIPVFIATIASNIADQPPFASSTVPDDELSADLQYAAGQRLELDADFGRAKAAYTMARDLDLLRFRAPSAINETIRALADEHELRLVDTNADLEEAAEHGLIGSDLMLEHLHPNAEGYALIADSFYQALDAAGLFGNVPPATDGEAARTRQWPILPAEIYFAAAVTADLKSDFPFVASPQDPALPPVVSAADRLGYALYEGSITWLGAAEESHRLATDPDARALAATLIAEARPFSADLNARAGSELLDAGRPADALRYFRRAIAEHPDRIDYRFDLVEAYRQLNRRDEALDGIDSILALDPGNGAARAAREDLDR